MYISMKFGMEFFFLYFAEKLVYLIMLASVQLAVDTVQIDDPNARYPG